jgi:predicted RND superfamily exporter protein
MSINRILERVAEAVEGSFVRWGELVVRHGWATAILVLGLTAPLLAQLPKLQVNNSVDAFFRDDDPAIIEYNAFREEFGRDHWVIAVIGPTNVLTPSVLDKLRAYHQELARSVPYVDRITSLVNARWIHGEDGGFVVDDLLGDWWERRADLEEIRRRVGANPVYSNWLISENHRYTVVIIRANTYSSLVSSSQPEETGSSRPRYVTDRETEKIVETVREISHRYEDSGFPVQLAGAPVIAERMNRRVESDILRSSVLAQCFIMVALYLLFRHVAAVVLPSAIVVLSLLCTLGLMSWSGLALSITTQILPTFLLTIGVCNAMHVLVIYYQFVAAGASREQAVPKTLGHCGFALLMTSLTTAAGLASFAFADVAQVAHLGVVAPFGVMLAMVLSVTLLPALLLVLPPPSTHRMTRTATAVGRTVAWVGLAASRRPRACVTAWLLVLAICAASAARVRFGQDLVTWFPKGDPIRGATGTLNREFKGILTFEAVVDGQEPGALHSPALLAKVRKLQDLAPSLVDGGLYIGKTLSVVDMLNEANRALHDDAPEFYRVPQTRELVAQELLLLESDRPDELFDFVDADYRKARVSMTVPWVDSQLYPPFVEKVQQRFSEVLGGSNVRVAFTGLTVLFGDTFAALFSSMAKSYLSSILVITLLMIILVGHVGRGLRSIVPNVIPLVATLGLMGALAIPLDMSTLLIGTTVLGLADDDTIHFFSRFNRELGRLRDPLPALEAVLSTTGAGMLFTSLIIAGGFMTFATCYMLHVRTFGSLIAFAAVVGFLAEMTLGPALLALGGSKGPEKLALRQGTP